MPAPTPLVQEPAVANAFFAPEPVSIALDVPIPAPAASGTFVLTATDGVLSWEVAP